LPEQRRTLFDHPALLILPVGVLLAQSVLFYPFTIDDAFISFRYAKHWAEGHGLVWNIGEAPVEGYTNFLLVVLLALGYRLGISPLIVAKTIGILSSVGIVVLIYGVARRVFRSSAGGMMAALLFSLTPMVGLHSVSGLETTLFAFWVTWEIAVALTLLQRWSGWLESWLYVLFLLSSLTRPEGVAMAAIVLGYLWIGEG